MYCTSASIWTNSRGEDFHTLYAEWVAKDIELAERDRAAAGDPELVLAIGREEIAQLGVAERLKELGTAEVLFLSRTRVTFFVVAAACVVVSSVIVAIVPPMAISVLYYTRKAFIAFFMGVCVACVAAIILLTALITSTNRKMRHVIVATSTVL